MAVVSYTKFTLIWLLLLLNFGLPLLAKDTMAVGYRHTHPDQVESYKNAGNVLTWETSKEIEQTFSTWGKGVYLALTPSGWIWKKQTDRNWHCFIKGKIEPVTKAAKIRIPPWRLNTTSGKKERMEMWSKRITAYIEDHCEDPETVIRLPYNEDGQHEILIPPALLNQEGGDLDLRTICSKDVNDLPNEKVDLNSPAWTANSKGSWEIFNVE